MKSEGMKDIFKLLLRCENNTITAMLIKLYDYNTKLNKSKGTFKNIEHSKKEYCT